jgi:hypothetical protein
MAVTGLLAQSLAQVSALLSLTAAFHMEDSD